MGQTKLGMRCWNSRFMWESHFRFSLECDASKRKTTAQLDLPTFGCAIDVGIEWKLHDLEAAGWTLVRVVAERRMNWWKARTYAPLNLLTLWLNYAKIRVLGTWLWDFHFYRDFFFGDAFGLWLVFIASNSNKALSVQVQYRQTAKREMCRRFRFTYALENPSCVLTHRPAPTLIRSKHSNA